MKQYGNCNSKGVVYLLECLNCHKQYVGLTSRCLKIREHIYSIEKATPNSPLGKHFSVPTEASRI